MRSSLDSDYERKIREEAAYWGGEASAKKTWWKRFLKSILERVGLYTQGVDYRKDIFFLPYRVIWDKKKLEKIFEIASNSEKILEIGCGSGWLSIEIARRNQNASIDAIDIAEGAISRGKSYYEEIKTKEKLGAINFIVGDLNKVDLQKGYYDVVIAFGVLQYIPELDRLMKQIREALKPNGYCVVYGDNGLCREDRDKLSLMFQPYLFIKNLVTGERINHEGIEMAVEKMYDWRTVRKSPFQDIQKPRDVASEIEKNFKKINKETTNCMIEGLIRRAPLPLKLLLSPPLKLFDTFLLKYGVLKEGRSLFIVAQK